MLSRSQREPGAPGRITISSSFLAQPPVVRRLLRGEYVAAARRDWQLQRYQVRVRAHPGETPGPAAPSPGRRDVSAPQACVPARPLDGTGLTSREITQTVRHLFTLQDAKLPLQGMQGQPMESVITTKMPVHHHK
jgi:hypothetical protein